MTEATTDGQPLPYPFGDGRQIDLEQRYAELRDTPGLVKVQLPYGRDCWLATRYEDARTVLGDPRFSRAAAVGPDVPRPNPEQPGDGGILMLDPPEHTRIRGVASRAFTARRVEEMRERTRALVERLVDEMVGHGAPADLVAHVALPLPVLVICEMLGVPFADRDDFQRWSSAFLSTTLLPPETVVEYGGALRDYMSELVEQRRAEPADDLISAMLRASDEQGRITRDELVTLAIGILVAGHETTATQLPNFVYVLDRERDQWDLLRERPDLVPRAVEELVRWVPLGVSSAFPRYAKEDVEVGGVLVRAGEPVLAAIGSANRDERVFPDADRVDVLRESNPHIGFGHGPHHCLGAQLARMELQEGLRALVTRLPDLRVAVADDELDWKSGMFVRGFRELPVTW
ncbi:cytochrome P450 [Streptoalloteichus hindustanus]|uniref:Cytochrome P450 n=1 Tax=Streptoalloteichus hindustanus TaxID=2017 RepID=A0A1M5BN75_STRHI|nr:cytochrome P450 [Streptoalloteichus hindustanus]SHF43941.1 Cytochrome P450 [Streptoalloteichus hindustanus]